MKKIFVTMCIAIIVLTGCEKSPMQQLASDHLYSGLTQDFWQKECDKQTNLWKEASTYCRGKKDKPNCAPVIRVYSYARWGNKEITGKLNEHPLDLPKF